MINQRRKRCFVSLPLTFIIPPSRPTKSACALLFDAACRRTFGPLCNAAALRYVLVLASVLGQKRSFPKGNGLLYSWMKGILHFFLFLTSHFQVLFRNTFLIGGQCCFLLPQHCLSVLRNAHTLPRPSAGARGTTSLLALVTVKCTSHQCTPLEQWRSRQVHTATCISDRSEAVVLQTHDVVSCITLFESCFFFWGTQNSPIYY